MAIVRVFTNIDGSVSIMRLNPRKPEITFAVEMAKRPELTSLSSMDIDESLLPDRKIRDKWRVKNGQIVIDTTVPDRLHPKQKLLDRIKTAATIDTVKILMEDIVLGKKE